MAEFKPKGITPLPWEMDELQQGTYDNLSREISSSTDDRYWIARLQTVKRGNEVRMDGEANARYLVQAANEYPRAINALLRIRREIECLVEDGTLSYAATERNKAWLAMCAVLAAAEREGE